MSASAFHHHSPDSRINWRVNPFGIASAVATVSALRELSREILMGLDQFMVCHLGSSDHSREQLCASRVYYKNHAMPPARLYSSGDNLWTSTLLHCAEMREQ